MQGLGTLTFHAGENPSITGLALRVPVCWRRQWHPTPVLLPGKPHGWRSLVGCSPWGREESDMTEQLHFHFSLSYIGEGNGNPLQCSCLENPRDGEPGGLLSMGSHRVGHDWSDLAAPTPVFWPREFHGLYSPRGCKELDINARLSLHFKMYFANTGLMRPRDFLGL